VSRVVYSGERHEESLGPRLLRSLRPHLQQAVEGLGGKVTQQDQFALTVEVPEEAEDQAEAIITEAMADNVMNVAYRTNRVMLTEHGMIRGGTFTPVIS
jgi:hypothetical protein